jgi:filamin
MRNSPFRLRVGGKDASDPLAVLTEGAGLKGGETGQKLEYIINTCNSGSGTLHVSTVGT